MFCQAKGICFAALLLCSDYTCSAFALISLSFPMRQLWRALVQMLGICMLQVLECSTELKTLLHMGTIMDEFGTGSLKNW